MIRRLLRFLVGTDAEIAFLQAQYDFVSDRLTTYHEFLKEERDLLRRQRGIDAEHRKLLEARMARVDYYLQNFSNTQGVGMPRELMSDEDWEKGAGPVERDEIEEMQFGVDSIINMALEPEEEEEESG